jgi:hypothetical protein
MAQADHPDQLGGHPVLCTIRSSDFLLGRKFVRLETTPFACGKEAGLQHSHSKTGISKRSAIHFSWCVLGLKDARVSVMEA